MKQSAVIASALLTLGPTLAFARATPRQAPLESYDYIIVGAGAGSLTVANRLSEDSSEYLLSILNFLYLETQQNYRYHRPGH